MKAMRFISAMLVVAFIALFAYANLRQLTITEKLKPVNLVSYSLTGNFDQHIRDNLERKINSVTGVTAFTINPEGTTASVIYHPGEVTEDALSVLLSEYISIQKKELASTGGCPVHQVSASFHQLITQLDLRTR
ncbi:MAG TPA: hypothetical protein VIN08_24025 [Ohtaekwangia sp.]|uniref:hypothetical protein n=1 Tax=Ohtaekwangia sp. TaxID=2066019 RepID=UPI002F91D6BB